jgi:ribonuclease P protein component
MLSFTYRFHGHGSLRYVYKNGTAIRTRLITIKRTSNARRKTSRFAVIVSKKVHKSAVGRNRIRRRLYEIIRLEMPKMTSAHDVAVMVFSSEVLAMPAPELTEMVQQLFTQANLYN